MKDVSILILDLLGQLFRLGNLRHHLVPHSSLSKDSTSPSIGPSVCAVSWWGFAAAAADDAGGGRGRPSMS